MEGHDTSNVGGSHGSSTDGLKQVLVRAKRKRGEHTLTALGLPIQSEVMELPGAKMSTQVPKLE